MTNPISIPSSISHFVISTVSHFHNFSSPQQHHHSNHVITSSSGSWPTPMTRPSRGEASWSSTCCALSVIHYTDMSLLIMNFYFCPKWFGIGILKYGFHDWRQHSFECLIVSFIGLLKYPFIWHDVDKCHHLLTKTINNNLTQTLCVYLIENENVFVGIKVHYTHNKAKVRFSWPLSLLV